MGDMLLTSDQMKFFSRNSDVSRSFHTDWLWKENWNANENKYLIPFMEHPVPETREGFCF